MGKNYASLRPLMLDESKLKLSQDYHERNKVNFQLVPSTLICRCGSTGDRIMDKEKYREYSLEMSQRMFTTIASIVKTGDVEAVHTIQKYVELYDFRTPPLTSRGDFFFKTEPQYVIRVSLKNHPHLPTLDIPIFFGSRLDRFCRENPDSLVCPEKLIRQKSSLYCCYCYFEEFVEEGIPNMFKINGRIQYTPIFALMKDTRKPFTIKKSLVWYTAKKEVTELNYKQVLQNPEQIEAFEALMRISHLFGKNSISNYSFMTIGPTFFKLAGNALCCIYKSKKNDIMATEYKFITHIKEYEILKTMGDLDKAFGNIRFTTPTEANTMGDYAHETIQRASKNTKSKGDGFCKARTFYQMATLDPKNVLQVMKLIAARSQESLCREIKEEDFGLFAVPDTTDGKNVGLTVHLVPGVQISNRTTCRTNILQLFKQHHVGVPEGSSIILVGSNLEMETIFGATVDTICTVIDYFSKENIHFDIFIDMETCVGIIVSFNGAIVHDKLNVTPMTKSWVDMYAPEKYEWFKPNLLSYVGSSIPFINHDHNSKIVGYVRSRVQEINRPFPDSVINMYSYSNVTNLTYLHLNLNDCHDWGSLQNVIVAVGCLSGHNVEESILLNKSSAERGLFMTHDIKKCPLLFTAIDCLDAVEVVGFQKNRPLKNGSFMFEVLGVCRYKQYSTEIRVKRAENRFIFYYEDTLCKRKWYLQDYEVKKFSDGNLFVIVTMDSINQCNEGVKLSTKHAQKGIVAQLMPPEDLPFDKHGVQPDIVLNIGYFDRMTMGQSLEGLIGRYISDHGDIDHIYHGEQQLQNPKLIIHDQRKDKMFCGLTGEFIGYYDLLITGYRKYQQEAYRSEQSTGLMDRLEKRDICTGQFQKGKSNKGGVSLGVMENANVSQIGSVRFSYKLNDLACGPFENYDDPAIGQLNRTAAAANKVLNQNGFVLSLK